MNYSLTTSFLGSQLEEVGSPVWLQGCYTEVQRQTVWLQGSCSSGTACPLLRHHAAWESCTEDTPMHSCWKMKLQVGEVSFLSALPRFLPDIGMPAKQALEPQTCSRIFPWRHQTLVLQFILPGMYIVSNRICSPRIYPLHLSNIFLRQTFKCHVSIFIAILWYKICFY